jgi:6-phosphogluconate dehydrogenase
MIGLGRMGANVARRLMKGGHDSVVFDRTAETVEALTKKAQSTRLRLKKHEGHLPDPVQPGVPLRG